MIARWTIGFVVGTAIVWLTSPLFVRSYLPRELNRGVLTLPNGEVYRWRSEGYASSSVGQLGMVGASRSMTVSADDPVVALWGDSQAEGVCVNDDQKIFALASDDSGLTILPLARSGDSGPDWLRQIPFVEHELGVSLHVFLVTELADLADVSMGVSANDEVPVKTNTVINWVPDFVVHAARNLVTRGDGVTLRRLRFTVGPIDPPRSAPPKSESNSSSIAPNDQTDWENVLQAIKRVAGRPILVVYAPQLPSIIETSETATSRNTARIVTEDAGQDSFARLQLAAQLKEVQIVDLRDRLRESAQQDKWPHGFHNGRFGSGHLNRVGNEIVANGIADALENFGLLQHSDR